MSNQKLEKLGHYVHWMNSVRASRAGLESQVGQTEDACVFADFAASAARIPKGVSAALPAKASVFPKLTCGAADQLVESLASQAAAATKVGNASPLFSLDQAAWLDEELSGSPLKAPLSAAQSDRKTRHAIARKVPSSRNVE